LNRLNKTIESLNYNYLEKNSATLDLNAEIKWIIIKDDSDKESNK